MKRLWTIMLIIGLVSVLGWMPSAAQESNLTDACVSDYDTEVDYFPHKVDVQDAENFTVEYFNHYKVVTVTDAFDGADPFTYVLTQCGTPTPAAADFPDNTQFIDVPAADIIAMSTTQLPPLSDLGLVDNLVGLDTFTFVNTPAIRESIDNDELVAIGSGTEVNVERVLEMEPDIVVTYGFDPSSDAYPILIDAGIFTALDASWREPTPLARAEWLTYIALFYNQEQAANTIYDNIVTQYNSARELAATVPADEQPVVLVNAFSSFSETWLIPGADTYVGTLINDAGGQVALADQAPDDSISLSFETIYSGALDADIWITNVFGLRSVEGLTDIDARYADFAPVVTGNVWNNNLDVNANGGNNYFEMGVTNPHLILQDLVAIFHPELLPDHDFNFYRPLTPTADE
jgi:iron complex transport system substrate-binding protein